MTATNHNRYDIVVAGSGFAGSLTALILHQLGFKVCLLEKGRHPRFAIGESSTPVADMILRGLSSKYQLPWLHDFSRYGSWQRSHPEIICGIKRGFSFFKHYPGKNFTTGKNHINELLVAASANDILSDTNWMRADFDSFLINKVIITGIDYFDLAEITDARWKSSWDFYFTRSHQSHHIRASFFIDATGSPALLNQWMGVQSSSKNFLTDSFALFSHFHQMPHWMDILQKKDIAANDFPYDPDHSALHHILDEGWLWMLRFNDERTSAGFMLQDEIRYKNLSTEEIWNELLLKYPAIENLLRDATLAVQPGKIIRTGRLQRKLSQCFGLGWVALPHTSGFVDPLFSTGIAHTLTGIERIVEMLRKYWGKETLLQQHLQKYELAVFEELKLIDYLIAGSYKTMAHFELFNTWSMLYFVITIAYEKCRMESNSTGSFLHADCPEMMNMVKESFNDLLKIMSQIHKQDGKQQLLVERFTCRIRERIQPINTAGLLDPESGNMYRHTAVEL